MEAIKKDGCIEFNGVVLTEKIINYLKLLQQSENLKINTYREDISDAVCFLSKIYYEFSDDQAEKVLSIMHCLSILRSDLENLQNLDI
jgi:hypothetical protein